MKIWITVLLCFGLAVVGYVVGMKFPYVGPCEVDTAKITIGDYYGLIVNTLMMIATFLAIIVALCKESILRVFKHPAFRISLLEDGIVEDIDIEQPNPKADSYKCVAEIHNKGNKIAYGCEVCVSEVLHSKRKPSDKGPIRDVSGKKKLFWDAAFVDIPAGISKEIVLFEILSPSSFGSPNSGTATNCVILFNGITLPTNKTTQGFWGIKYYLNHKDGESIHFSIEIKWDGVWRNRKTEMKENLKIKITNL